ncbi:MAG: ABC transporter ATP-binding protein, partial [Oscillospiraceae bacterium]
MSMVKVNNITKCYKDVTALKNFSVEFEEGKIYGLLGRNGAGKSTLLNLITNRIFPTEGEVTVDGENVLENDNALSKIYGMSEKNVYPEDFKVKAAFKWTKEFYPEFDMDYAQELSKKFLLDTKKKLNGLSTGYTSIAKVIMALASNAPIILLDEPVLGLDANHRDLFYKLLVEDYSKNPRTIVISTHLIEEVAMVIEQVVIIKNGEKILDEPTETVLSKGYSISGPAGRVDEFSKGKQILGEDAIGGLKTVHIMGTPEQNRLPDGLEMTRL